MVILCILAALLCFVYCLIVFRIRSGNNFYLIWGAGGVFLMGLALMIRFDWWSQLPLVLRRGIGAVFIFGILLFVIVEGFIFAHYHDKGREDLDYIIVLGAEALTHRKLY